MLDLRRNRCCGRYHFRDHTTKTAELIVRSGTKECWLRSLRDGLEIPARILFSTPFRGFGRMRTPRRVLENTSNNIRNVAGSKLSEMCTVFCCLFWILVLPFWHLIQKYLNGRTAENCGNQTLSESTIEPIRSRLLRYWPDISKRDHLGLWEEAWEKHGTCSGLSQLEYFEEALDNLLPAPFIIRSTYGSAVQRQEIDQEYNNKAVLICNHRQWFKEVRLCFSRTPDGIPTVAVDCPEEIKNMDSCARIVQLSQFP